MLEMRGVSKSFHGVAVVHALDLSIAAGEVVVLLGPSGCGKTTILNIIAGLEAQQTGAVMVGDQAPKAGRHDIAYMFAQDALLPWRTVLDNVLFGVEVHASGRGVPLDTVCP